MPRVPAIPAVGANDKAGRRPTKTKPRQIGGRIAVVYAEGEIVDGEGERGYVGGTKFARELRRLRQDSDVKPSCCA